MFLAWSSDPSRLLATVIIKRRSGSWRCNFNVVWKPETLIAAVLVVHIAIQTTHYLVSLHEARTVDAGWPATCHSKRVGAVC